MCLAIPGRVLEIKGEKAKIWQKNHTHLVSLSLVDNVKVGDWLICQANFALNKIEKGEAENILKLNQGLNK